MPFQYSCFISYRSSQKDIVQDLVISLKTELSRWLDLEIFLDKERLKGGDFFNSRISQALCESVCLIVVYTPTYFSSTHTYCAREYKAMEELEIQRFKLLGLSDSAKHGLIIPIVYRGNNKIPEKVKSKRHCYFFGDYQISGQANLDYPEYAKIVEEIAEYIGERCDELLQVEEDACVHCDTFEIPSEADISDWLKDMLPPKPKLPSREKCIT